MTSIALRKSKKKWRPPNPPPPIVWHMMAVLFQAARVGWETAGMIGFWESYIIGVPFTFVEYWMRRRFYESSLFNGRPTWVLALASVLSWHGYTYLMIIDLARDIKHRWWR